jgi:hypothetical protein
MASFSDPVAAEKKALAVKKLGSTPRLEVVGVYVKKHPY